MRRRIQVHSGRMKVFQVGRMVWSEDNGLILPELFSRPMTSGKSLSWRLSFLIFLRGMVVMMMAKTVALVGVGGLGGGERDKHRALIICHV